MMNFFNKKVKEKETSDELKKQLLNDFAEAWKTLNAELMIIHFDDDFVYDSQWVFASLDCEGYKDYIRGKFEKIKETKEVPLVK